MMLRLACLFLLSLTATVMADNNNDEQPLSFELMAKFQHWTLFHQKEYDSHEQKMERLRIWLENDERIQAHNSQVPAPKYTLGHNAYSDMTEAEFAEYFNLKAYQPAEETEAVMEEEDEVVAQQRRALLDADTHLHLPDFIDWRALGAVTEVKNQGNCGACWAFSTTGALEGARFIMTGDLVSLSEQNLLDCDHTDMGCNGGLMDNAFKFDTKNGGLCSEDDYPYMARANAVCNTNCSDVEGSIVKTFVDVPPGNEKALLSAIAMQPVSVAIEGSSFSFQFYKSGVLADDSCGRGGNIDHGVLAVGYGTDLDTQEPYFLVKNSWGPTWGDEGYVKLGRKTKNEFGICSILKMASFPIVQ